MRPPPAPAFILGTLILCLPATLFAQNYSGTFTASNQQGGTVTVTLQQGQYGELTGSMTGDGVHFQIEGMVEEGMAMGVISSAEGGVFFEGSLQGNQLTLVLIDVGPGNMPDYSSTQTVILTRAGGGGAAMPRPGGGGNPLGRGGAGAPGASAQSAEPLLGRWRCQAPDGPALLEVLSNTELTYNGQRTTFQLGQGVMRVQEDWGMAEYRYRIEGDRMTVTNPDRSVTQCQRQQAPAAGARGGMEALLQGQRCAYSSSPDGGFATTYMMYFDGQGRFVWGTESSFSGDPGMAYGLHNNPDAGSYRVGGTSRGSEIYLTWPNGDPGVATVTLGDADGIYEFQLNGRHFAAGLCGY
jgi:hypothetical protein